jgi:large subunit ribosomal protein L18
MESRNQKRLHRKRRTTVKTKGTAKMPRTSIFRSNKAIYAQLVDDEKGVTLATASSRELKEKDFNIKTAEKTGELLAEKALKLKLKEVTFDRSGYRYHGKVKALAEGMRKGKLKF